MKSRIRKRIRMTHSPEPKRRYWADRLARLKALGLNAVATYVPWNFHEEEEGTFNFAGDRNLTAFLRFRSLIAGERD